MPDATYVGAGTPCGNCGNPLTPGQPHKCGRTPEQPTANPYRKLDDEFDHAAEALTWDEGFAAGRAAATPDPPTDERRPWPIAPDTVMPPRRQPVRWGSRADDPPTEIHDDPGKTKAYLAGLAAGRTEAAAASPDERLREAGERLAQAVARVCGEGHPALGMWRAALAAADREENTDG